MGLCKLGVWAVVKFSSRKLFLGHKAIFDFPIFYLFQIFWGLLGPIWTPYPKPWCVLCDWNFPDTNVNNKNVAIVGPPVRFRACATLFLFFNSDGYTFRWISSILQICPTLVFWCTKKVLLLHAVPRHRDLPRIVKNTICFSTKEKLDLLSHVNISDSAAIFYSNSLGFFLVIENEGTLGSGVGTFC